LDQQKLNNLFRKSNPLYLITDRKISGLTHVQMARRAVNAGVRVVQLRDKGMSKKDIYKEALSIREITAKHNALFIVNDYIDIALAVNADGVHLGQEDMPVKEARRTMGRKKIIGISTHSLRQAKEAQDGGADYIGFGPMFHTSTKDAGRPKGVKALSRIRQHIRIPIVAIGGITWENINDVLDAGADACAVASGVLSGDIRTNLGKYHSAIVP
jgi:thiamine-phosphate pyrophosphorylase